MTATARPAVPPAPPMPWRADLLTAACTMAAVLAAFGAAYGLRTAVGFSVQNVVLAVVLTLTLSRTMARAQHHPALLAVEIPVVGLAAAGAGWLVVHEPWVGQPLLALALCAGLLARRWGGLARQAGRLVSLPFLALLVTPAPSVPTGNGSELGSLLWSPAVGLLAVACAGAGTAVRNRLLAAAPAGTGPAPRRARRRIDPSTRMAAQMAVGLGASLAAGHLLFGDRWAWVLLSAYIVASGNRGRGDVVHKAGLRVLGAGVGTVGVSLGTAGLPAGNRWLIVALFAVLAVALVLRERSYAFWAAGVTAMVALLHAFYGDTGTSALRERALGVVVGSVLGLAAAWFVLPVRTTDVLRRRVANCLAALTDDLAPDARDAAMPTALRALDEITPTLRAHRRTLGRRRDSHPLHVVAALHRLAELPIDERSRRVLRRDVVRVRRAIIGADDLSCDELPGHLASVHAFLQATARSSR